MRTTIALSGAGLALGLVLGPAAALADSTTAPVRPFVLPDLSGLTMIGVDLQLTSFQIPQPAIPPPGIVEVDQTNLTFDVAAEVSIAPHWVLLARLPLAYHAVEDDEEIVGDPECCDTAIGNVTLGARVLDSSTVGTSSRSVIGGEFTVSLPTAPDDGDGALTAAFAGLSHLPHDPGRYFPNTTTVRFAGGGQLYGQRFMVQAGGGFDIFVFDDDAAGDDDTDFAMRLGLAAGVRATYEIAFIAELNGLLSLDNDDNENDGVGSFNLGVRYGSDALLLGLRAYLPIDDQLNDLDMVGLGFDVGARI